MATLRRPQRTSWTESTAEATESTESNECSLPPVHDSVQRQAENSTEKVTLSSRIADTVSHAPTPQRPRSRALPGAGSAGASSARPSSKREARSASTGGWPSGSQQAGLGRGPRGSLMPRPAQGSRDGPSERGG